MFCSANPKYPVASFDNVTAFIQKNFLNILKYMYWLNERIINKDDIAAYTTFPVFLGNTNQHINIINKAIEMVILIEIGNVKFKFIVFGITNERSCKSGSIKDNNAKTIK